MGLLQAVRAQAIAASEARELLRDDLVAELLREVALRLRKERSRLLRANDDDVAAAIGKLDSGALDRLRLDNDRLEIAEEQLLTLADMPALERESDGWSLANGLRVSVRRIPVGVIGANFEARPLVALDIASQLLKSQNAGLLRTGGAALRTVSELVDHVISPALQDVGVPPQVIGLVRSKDHAAAVALVSLPHEVPLVILRGSGATTAQLAQHAAAHGVQTLAHAEGGGVLYVDEHSDRSLARQIIGSSLDRLGVCNRLNLLLVHQNADCAALVDALHEFGVEPCGTARARAQAGMAPVDVPLRYEWAGDPGRIATVTVHVVESLEEALVIANRHTSGLAAGIVTNNEAAASAFLDGYRGTTVFWHAPTRFADGHALTGAPETGINTGLTLGPRGPVTYRDLWLRQYRVIGDGTQAR